jgi:nucleoside-triphosphatase THEP1
LSEIKNAGKFIQKVFIITGAIGEGKTTMARNLAEVFKKNNIQVGGILSERIMTNAQTTGYDLVDIETNDKEILLRQNDETDKERIGRFAIYPEGIKKGIALLTPSRIRGKRIVVIDEVGLLELENRGWSYSLQNLINESANHILIAVRDSMTKEVIEKWNLKDTFIYRVSETDYLTVSKLIIDEVNS